MSTNRPISKLKDREWRERRVTSVKQASFHQLLHRRVCNGTYLHIYLSKMARLHVALETAQSSIEVMAEFWNRRPRRNDDKQIRDLAGVEESHQSFRFAPVLDYYYYC